MKFGFTAQVLAAMLVGIGWVLPTIVYQYERFSLYLYYKNEARKMNRKLQNMPR